MSIFKTFLLCNAVWFGVLAIQFTWYRWRTRRRTTAAKPGGSDD